jgi:preprotein translocase subunit SecA
MAGAARGLPTGPAVRGIRESLGDQQVSGGPSGGARPGFTPTGARIGRNEPCWCGSGNKYKKCHGR